MVKLIRKLDQFAFGVAGLLMALFMLGYAYSWVEGYVDPVMGPMSVSNARQGPNKYDVTFDSEAYKLRECDWLESRWYIGERFELSAKTDWDFAGKPKIREGGLLIWLNQVAGMSPKELFHNSHADAVHRCPWRLWNTVTPLYDSNDDIPMPEIGPPIINELQQEVEQLRLEVESLK